jgi:hypothetical protein
MLFDKLRVKSVDDLEDALKNKLAGLPASRKTEENS